jgi:NHL repeat-containing protein
MSDEDVLLFNRPTDIAFASNGDFYVSDGYGNSRVVKFSRDGSFLKSWGSKGNGAGCWAARLPSTTPAPKTISSRGLSLMSAASMLRYDHRVASMLATTMFYPG